MSLDTKYRPLRYSDVLGQDATIEVCKQIVIAGKGFHQSYVFAGSHGGGKTTCGRILARAMLCASPVDGDPCDECESCLAVLNDASENFIEVDAATNSGKDDVRRITEEAQFGSFSGKRKVYLFDECFTEDTMLITPEGSQSIKDLVEQKYDGLVLSRNVETGEQCWQPVTNWYDIQDERECLTLEFDSGVVLTVTTDQELFTMNRGWVAVSKLELARECENMGTAGIHSESYYDCDGDGCSWCGVRQDQFLDRSEEPVSLLSSTSVGKKKVYDVTVADTHSFFAYSRYGNQEHAILAHNCHELSRAAMDAMLKPLEDNIRGSQERQLVCIFCTTEPKKMRPAIMSRCAPAFKIRLNTPEEIAKRLAFIMDSEKLDYDPAVLPVVAEVCECHIRDSIKAVEGVSMLGKVDRENVERYLHLDANVLYLDLLESLGTDLPRALMTVEKLIERVSPATCYERMADISMMAYRLSYVGHATVPSYWDRDRVKRAGDLHKEFLVQFAQCFAERPAYATMSMLLCDVGALHQKRAGIRIVATTVTEVALPATRPAPTPLALTTAVGVPATVSEPEPSTALEPEAPAVEPEAPAVEPAQAVKEEPVPEPVPEPMVLEEAPPEPAPAPIKPLPKTEPQKTTEPQNEPAQVGSIAKDPFVNAMGVHINPQAQQMSRGSSSQKGDAFGTMPISSFTEVLHRRVIELTEEKSTSGRQARRDDVGSP